MKKIYSFWEDYKFPIAMAFIAIFLVGFGNFFQDPLALTTVPLLENEIFQNICTISRYLGFFIIQIFPMMVLIRLLSRRYEDNVVVFNGILAYFVFNAMTMFFSPSDLPSYYYNPVLGMNVVQNIANANVTKYPLFTGVISAFIVASIVGMTYRNSRRRFSYGFLGFINNDVWAMIGAAVLSTFAGVLFAYGWPFVIRGLSEIFSLIASDIYNPTNLFLYGFVEQILSIFNLQNIIHSPFWFGAAGGSWMDNFGQIYSGDISIWTALTGMNATNINYGRFITPYYIMNLFAVPGMFISLFTLTTDKLKRRRYGLLLAFGILVSFFTGLVWPVNIFLAITAPALFFAHTIIFSSLYAFLPALDIMVGYSYAGTVEMATPGTFSSFYPVILNPRFTTMGLKLLVVGLVIGVIYYVLFQLYYRYIAADFLDENKNNTFNEEVIAALGGTGNIRLINSTFQSISVHLYDPSQMDNQHLMELGANKIVDTRSGIEIEFGPRSTNICRGIEKEIERYLEEQRSKPIVSEKGNLV